MHFCKALGIAVAVGLVMGCSTGSLSSIEHDKTVRFTVLHTNDHHGRFWRNRDGEYGMAARKTVVDAIRREVAQAGGTSLLLDGGDVNTGVPESDLQDAIPDFKGMNLLGYDAMAVGNHEFDKSPFVLKMQRELAQFPMLSANIYRQGERMFDPYKLFNVGGLRIAVMGLTTEDTQKMVHPDNVRQIEFRNPIQEAARLVPELRAKADVVIAATHMGHYQNGEHGTQAPGDVEMARAVKGIDLIVGGHTQNPACMSEENVIDRAYVPGGSCKPDFQNGTWIVQAHEWGKYVGRADFEYRKGTLTLVKYALIPVNLKMPTAAAEIAEDQAMLALLSPFQEFGQQKLLIEVGSTDAKLEGDRTMVRSQPTSLGVMVATAMMQRTQADFAIVNAGGVRDSLPAGTLNYKDVLKVHPFGNTIVTVDLRGDELLRYLNVAAAMTPGAGAFAQFAGIQLVITGGTVTDASIASQPISANKTYRMAMNNFMASGGDGYPNLSHHPTFVHTGFVDAEVLRAFIAERSPLKAADYAPGNSVVRH
jgi:5'-nucleotidase / UDP-sugar diphosphatase